MLLTETTVELSGPFRTFPSCRNRKSSTFFWAVLLCGNDVVDKRGRLSNKPSCLQCSGEVPTKRPLKEALSLPRCKAGKDEDHVESKPEQAAEQFARGPSGYGYGEYIQ